MGEYSVATAAPIPLDYNGKRYFLSPLRLSSWGELEMYVRQRYMRLANATVGEVPKEEKLDFMVKAMDRASSLNMSHAAQLAPPDLDLLKDQLIDAAEKVVRARDSAVEEDIEEAGKVLSLATEGLMQASRDAVARASSEAKVVSSILSSPDGLIEMLFTSFRIRHPRISRDLAEEVINGCGQKPEYLMEELIRISIAGKGKTGDNPKEGSGPPV